MSGTEIEPERAGMFREQELTEAKQTKTIILAGLTEHRGGQKASVVVKLFLAFCLEAVESCVVNLISRKLQVDMHQKYI